MGRQGGIMGNTFWPGSKDGGLSARMEAHELQVLLACGDPQAAKAPPPWRRIGGEFPDVNMSTGSDPFRP